MNNLTASPPTSDARIREIFQRFEVREPRPQSELIYTTDFSLLVSVILSAQATDASVNAVMKTLRPLIDSPQKVVKLGEEALAHALRSLNIYRHKAHYVFATAQKLLQDFGGNVPHNPEELITLPGVGRKTANVVLNVLHGAQNIAVDTHVFRVSHRLQLSAGTTPTAVEQDLYRVVPKEYWARANHWLVLHGRFVCKARKPHCEQCFIKDLCPFACSSMQR